jgi:20S proteasome alpha/beta subunit
MTVVVGLKFQEGIVLAADKEESDDYLRDQVQKIQRLRFPNEMIAGIAGSGDGHFIDFAAEEIKNYLWAHPEVPISRVGAGIETVLKGIFTEHIFATNLPPRERPGFGLLVGCNHRGTSKLFKTHYAAPLEVFDFAASGAGRVMRKFS